MDWVFDRLFLTKHCRCFDEDAQGADGAADLLQALSHSPLLEELDLRNCPQIPATAWQKFQGAKWLNLKKAAFTQCLAERNGWKVFVFYSGLNLSLLETVRIQEHGEICEVVVLWVVVGWGGFKMDCIPALVVVPRCFRQIVSGKTLQVLLQRHPRSRWSRRFASSLEPVVTPGRVGSSQLSSDPGSSVAKTSWCQVV